MPLVSKDSEESATAVEPDEPDEPLAVLDFRFFAIARLGLLDRYAWACVYLGLGHYGVAMTKRSLACVLKLALIAAELLRSECK